MFSDYEDEMNMMQSLRYLKEHLRRSELIASKLVKYPGFKKENVYLDSDIMDVDCVNNMREAFRRMNIDITKILEKFMVFHYGSEEDDIDDLTFFADEDCDLEYLSLFNGE